MSASNLARWQRQERLSRWARNRLPAPVRRALWTLYLQLPAARLYRKGVADRMRVAELVHEKCGGIVQRGPFAGMVFPFVTTDAAAKCLGSYERELHPEVERIIAHGYTTVLNVGCAEGYYAVGFARAMPDAHVFAYDTNAKAVEQCQQLAAANGLAGDRIVYGGEVTHSVLDALARPGTIVLADIEGGEVELLDPERAPNLAHVDMMVELHHNVVPDVEQVLRARFQRTHDIRFVDSESRTDASHYPELVALSLEDQQTAMFERPLTMRWLLLETKS